MPIKLIDKCIVDTEVHHIVYVTCVGYYNQNKTENAPILLICLEHIISNDEIHGPTLRLFWIEDALCSNFAIGFHR